MTGGSFLLPVLASGCRQKSQSFFTCAVARCVKTLFKRLLKLGKNSRDPNAVVEIGHVDRNLVQEFINAAEKILHPFYDVSSNDPQGYQVFIQKNIFIAA